MLGTLVRDCIEQHISAAKMTLLRVVEDSERAIITQFAKGAAMEWEE